MKKILNRILYFLLIIEFLIHFTSCKKDNENVNSYYSYVDLNLDSLQLSRIGNFMRTYSTNKLFVLRYISYYDQKRLAIFLPNYQSISNKPPLFFTKINNIPVIIYTDFEEEIILKKKYIMPNEIKRVLKENNRYSPEPFFSIIDDSLILNYKRPKVIQ